MSYGLKYKIELTNKKNKLVEIEMHEKDYTGSWVYLDSGATAPELTPDLSDHFRGTSLLFSVEAKDDAGMPEFFVEDPRRYKVVMKYSGVVEFIGFLVPEVYEDPYVAAPFDIELTATDGLGLLKNIDFDLTGYHSDIACIDHILRKTGHELPVSVAVDVQYLGQPTMTLPAMAYARTNTAKFYSDKGDPDNCYDALKKILASYGLELYVTQWRNRWLVFRTIDLQGEFVTFTNAAYTSRGSLFTPSNFGKNQPCDAVGSLNRSLNKRLHKVHISNKLGRKDSVLPLDVFEQELVRTFNRGNNRGGVTYMYNAKNWKWVGNAANDTTQWRWDYLRGALAFVVFPPYTNNNLLNYIYYQSPQLAASGQPWVAAFDLEMERGVGNGGAVNIPVDVQHVAGSTVRYLTESGWSSSPNPLKIEMTNQTEARGFQTPLPSGQYRILLPSIPSGGYIRFRLFRPAEHSSRYYAFSIRNLTLFADLTTSPVPEFVNYDAKISETVVNSEEIEVEGSAPEYPNSHLLFANVKMDPSMTSAPYDWIHKGDTSRIYPLAVVQMREIASNNRKPRQILSGRIDGVVASLAIIRDKTVPEEPLFWFKSGSWDLWNDAMDGTFEQLLPYQEQELTISQMSVTENFSSSNSNNANAAQASAQTSSGATRGTSSRSSSSWVNITGKPETFPPSAHTHIVSEVTGLQSALDAKAKKEGDITQDFHVNDLHIAGQVNQWLAQQLVVDDARIQVNRRQDGATVDSGLVIYNKDTSSEVSSLVYDVNGIWRAGGSRLFTEAYNPKLGGYAAGDYPRKSENATITEAWTFNNNLTIGGNVGTNNFVSQMQGWRVTSQGQADFRHIYTDELQAKAFTADISQALVGSDVLTKSVAKLAQNWATTANGATSTIYVEELEGFPGFQVFAVGDRLLLRLFDRTGGGLLIKNIWATVASYVGATNNVQRYTITVNSGGATGQTVYAGSMILDYGTPGSGVIERTVLDQQGSPYSRVSTWVNNPWTPGNYTLHYQSGNLNGIPNAEGWGVYSENSFLTGKLLVGDLTKAGQYMEYANGQLTIRGKIQVTGGNAATKADVDAVQVGGRNLWKGSRTAPKQVTVTQYGYLDWGRELSDVAIREGQTVTFGFSVVDIPAGEAVMARVDFYRPDGTYTSHTYGNEVVGEGRTSITFVVPNLSEFDRIRFRVYPVDFTATYHVKIYNEKLETGNKATDWTPAPEDVDAAIQDQQIYVEYSVNGSTNWHTTFAPGDIYMRQKKGSGAWSAAIRIVGEKGAAGAEGRYTDYQFAKNTSTSTAPTSGWQDSPPAISAGEYVWMRTGEVVPPATSPSAWSTATRVTGDKGAKGDKGDQGVQGIAGPKGADGKTYYTWVKYADSPTTGMSDYPSGKAYIGLAHNKTTATESSNYADYNWSLIKGTDGQPGAKGANGVTYYTWIKYADTPTSGMSDSPTGKTYIGLAVNKTTATESTAYGDYTWSLIKGADGADGRSVTGTDVEFAQSTSATTAPTSGWQTTAPAWIDGRYIWTRTKTTYSSGSPTYSAAVNLTGAKGNTGNTGATGTGVSSITEEYYLSTSKTSRTGGSWVTTPPTWEVGKYMWTRVKIIYKNPTSTAYTDPVVSSEWEAIDSLEYVGRNLALDTNKGTKNWRWSMQAGGATLSSVFEDHVHTCLMTRNSSAAGSWSYIAFEQIQPHLLQSGAVYTATLMVKASVVTTFYARIIRGDGTDEMAHPASADKPTVVGQWTKIRFVLQMYQNPPVGVPGGQWLYLTMNSNPGVTYQFKDLKFEKGTRITDWTPAPEDTPVSLEYLTKALQGESEINGGLILASVLAARDSGGTVRSYQNGDPALNDIAFAAGVENFGVSGETQNIALKHSGAAKIGAFSVSETGEIEMIDPSTQTARLRFATVNLPSISSLYNGVAYSGTPSIGSGSTSGTQTLTGSFTILHDGVTVNFTSGTITITGIGRSHSDGLPSFAMAELMLYRDSRLIARIDSAKIRFFGTNLSSDSLTRPIPARSMILNAGTYTFRLLCTSDGDVIEKNATSTAFTGSYNYNLRNVKRQQYGLDGMMLFYSDNHFHFTEHGGLDARAETNKWNAPGALLGGRMVGTGTVTNWWGPKVGSGSGKTSTAGEYQINHTIGHLNYFISATPTTDVRLRITAKTNNYFRIRSSSSAEVTFDYVVIGNNY